MWGSAHCASSSGEQQLVRAVVGRLEAVHQGCRGRDRGTVGGMFMVKQYVGERTLRKLIR
jgi:hypothetical protein